MDDRPETQAPEGADDAEALFALAADEHLDADSIETGVAVLLARYPGVPVAAMKADGVCVPIPPTLDLNGNVVLEARSGMDLVAEPDRLRLLATWDTVLERGAARCLAHMAGAPDRRVTFYGFDLRERHDAVLVVFVPAAEGDDADTGAMPPPAPERARPRFATVSKDERSFITEIDEALTQILGWSPEEIVGHRSIEFIHPDDHALAIDNWMQMLASPGPGRRVRLRHRCRDGAWVWFEVTNHNLLDDADRHCVISELVDISDEMAAQEEVRARQELLDSIAEAMPIGLLHLDAERAVVYTNDRLHQILGVEREPDAERQLASLLDDDRMRMLAALDYVLASGMPADIEVHLQPAGAPEPRLCAVNLRALRGSGGPAAGAVACFADVTDSARMREELRRRATFDELTGCYNRASITRMLEATVEDAEPDDGAPRHCAVMFIDVDDFKSINDELGHAAGDQVLRVLAERLRRAVRGGDHVGRLGGDEFLAICPDVESPHVAARLRERIEQLLCSPVALAAGTVRARASVGVAWTECPAVSAEALVARADQAMYDVKHRRRNGADGSDEADAGAPPRT